jgi:uncharacterized protein involved in exopolysaccharide biosynthesis
MSETSSVSFLDYLYIWLRWRRFILRMIGASAVLSILISFILPVSYLASTSILPPKPESPLGLSSAFSSLGASLDLLGLGKTEELDTYLAILESRSAREAAISRFELQTYYRKKTLDETLKAFDSDIEIEITKENILMLSIVHEDSVRAAEIANFFIEELDRINKRLANEKAASNRIFIESRLDETRQRLASAEEDLKRYQKEHGTIALSEESRAALLAGAELESRIMGMEVQQEALRRRLGASHPVLLEMSSEIDAAKHRLAGLPDIGLDMGRLFREVEIQTRLLAFLIPQYEQARIQEARDTPTVQTLDRARPPQRKYAPRRMFIVGGAMASSLVIALFLSLALEALRQARAQGAPRGRRFDQIATEWRSIWKK